MADIEQPSDIEAFIHDPVDYFDWSLTAMHSLPREETKRLQLEGLKLRFNTLKDRIGMLQRLADGAGIDAIDKVEDAVPLLFEHTVYKSYPASLLAQSKFDKLTAWLQKLTTHDLSTVDTRDCEGVDDWIDRLDAQSPLCISHSSGTSGTLSFIPWSKGEMDRFGKTWPVAYFQQFGDPRPADDQLIPNCHVISGLHRKGGSMAYRINDLYAKYLAGAEERLHCAFPGKLSSDMTYLAAKIRAAKARGELDKVEIPPALQARMKEYEEKQRNQPAQVAAFLKETTDKVKGERVFMGAVWNVHYNLAMKGLEEGHRHVFASNSCIASGGGSKGLTVPDDWKERVMEYTGVDSILMGYGMSEISSHATMCSEGHYHLFPWVIPYVLDPDTSDPLPRTGVQTGRAAFFDLMADSRWGGFVTGDQVTLDWDTDCACGRTSVFVHDSVSRYSEARGGDDKINCVAALDAHAEALDYLTSQ